MPPTPKAPSPAREMKQLTLSPPAPPPVRVPAPPAPSERAEAFRARIAGYTAITGGNAPALDFLRPHRHPRLRAGAIQASPETPSVSVRTSAAPPPLPPLGPPAPPLLKPAAGNLYVQHLACRYLQLADHIPPAPPAPPSGPEPFSPASPIASTRTLLTPAGTVSSCWVPVGENVFVTVGGVAAAPPRASPAAARRAAKLAKRRSRGMKREFGRCAVDCSCSRFDAPTDALERRPDPFTATDDLRRRENRRPADHRPGL